MGDMLGGGGGLTSSSVLSRQQRALLGPLSQLFGGVIEGLDFGGIQDRIGILSEQLGRDTTDEALAASREQFQGLLGPALRQFTEQALPGIGEQFAGIGGTLSSRRGQSIMDARTNVQLGAQDALARLLPSIQAAPLQRTLGQIQGLSGLQQTQMAPLQQALAFALSPTRQNFQQSGSGLLGDLVGAGATLGGAKLGQEGASLGLMALLG